MCAGFCCSPLAHNKTSVTLTRARGTMAAMPATTCTHYPDLRAQVRDGDTLAVIATGIYGAALRLGAMGPYGHVGMVRSVTIDGVTRVMVVEENPGGGRYTPLSHYKNTHIHIYSAPAGIDGRAASGRAVQLLDGLADYDWKDIRRLARWGAVRALASLFDDPLPTPAHTEVSEGRGGVICSALVTAAYTQTGWVPSGSCAWPSALCLNLGAPRITYTPHPPTA